MKLLIALSLLLVSYSSYGFLSTPNTAVSGSLSYTDLPGVTTIPGAIRFVRKFGSDVTCTTPPAVPCGNGSFAYPFLTVGAAYASVTNPATTVTFDIGPGTYTELSSFVWRPNSLHVHSEGYGGSVPTTVLRAGGTAIPATLIGNQLLAFHGFTVGGGGFDISRPVGDIVTGPPPILRLRNMSLAGTKKVTGSGTGVATINKSIQLDFDNVSTLDNTQMLLNGVTGSIRNSSILDLKISGLTVDGGVTASGPGNITHTALTYLTLDQTPASSDASTNLIGTTIFATLTEKGPYSGSMRVAYGALNSNTALAGNITSGGSTISGLSFVPTNASSVGATTSSGIPVWGQGIPSGTLLGTTPSAGVVNLVDAAGNPVLATATLTGSMFYFGSGLKFTSSAATTQIIGSGASGMTYIPAKASNWSRFTPSILSDALDHLAEPADGTHSGLMAALAQTFGGVKTFLRNLVITNAVNDTTAGSPTSIVTGEPNTLGLTIKGSTTSNPAPGSTFFASYASSINATVSSGSGTGTVFNGAGITGSFLDLTGGSGKAVSYSAVSNWDQSQVFTVRFNVKPNYSGSPGTVQYLFSRSDSTASGNGLVAFYHLPDGNLNLITQNGSGSLLFDTEIAAWSPTAGTVYEIEIDVDLLTGATRLFVDGTQQGSTITTTGSVPVSAGVFTLGYQWCYSCGPQVADFSVSNFVIYPTIQHTANFAGEIPRVYIGDQMADLQRWLSSSGMTLAKVKADGTATFPNLAGMPSSYLSFSSGLTTVLTANEILAAGKTVRSMTVENFTGAASVLNTCTVNPTIKLYDCGPSTGACTSGVEMATVTIAAANTTTDGSVSSGNIAAGHYWAFLLTAGSCVSIDATGSAEAIMQ